MSVNFGKRIEQTRKELGLTRAELSAKLGISQGSLRDLEVLNATPRHLQELLPRLAAELNKNMMYLLTGNTTTIPANTILTDAEKIIESSNNIIRTVQNS